MNDLKGLISQVEDLKKDIESNLEMITLLEQEEDEELLNEINHNIETLSTRVEELNVLLLLRIDTIVIVLIT